MFRLAKQTIPLQVCNDNSAFPHIFYSEITSFKNINLKLHSCNGIIINKNYIKCYKDLDIIL